MYATWSRNVQLCYYLCGMSKQMAGDMTNTDTWVVFIWQCGMFDEMWQI